jgi:AcrR family transcriptional regulator
VTGTADPTTADPTTADPPTTDPPRWGRRDEPDAARDGLLDAAGRVFARRGVLAVTVADVAAEAGCARGTVYRYFADREQLRRAFVDRESERVWAQVTDRIAMVTEPRRALVEGVLAAVAAVRDDPVLAAWFTGSAAVAAGELSLQAGVIRDRTERWVRHLVRRARAAGASPTAADAAVATDAVVRVIVSLLTVPATGATAAAASARERRLVEAVLVPAVLGPPPP